MKNILLIFGSEGALGKGITKVMTSKNYDEIFLFDSKNKSDLSDNRIKKISVDDLSIEKNVDTAFNFLQGDKNSRYFLASTIGGYFGGKEIAETDEKDFERMFDINLKVNYFLLKRFIELVKECDSGSACFISALTAINPEALKFVYGASKSALNYMIKVASFEGAKIRLSINAIAPSTIDTPANREWAEGIDYESWVKTEEIGELVHSLFENYNFISGNIIEIKNRFMR